MFDTFFAFETPWVTEYETFAKCDSWFYHELILRGIQSSIVLFLIWFLCLGGIEMQFELYQNIKCTWKGGQDLVRVRRSTDRSIFSITCRSTAALTTCDNLILWRTIEEWNPDRLCAPLSNILLTWPDTVSQWEIHTDTVYVILGWWEHFVLQYNVKVQEPQTVCLT